MSNLLPGMNEHEMMAFWKRCHDDPVFFCKHVLGFTPWSKQAELMRSVTKHDRVAVSSAHKLGKSSALVVLALWWAYTREDARVPMTNSSYHQVKKILWRELTRIYNKSLLPLGGTLYRDPSEGLIFPNGNEIFGFSTDTPERAAGISGANVMYIVDEASGAEETMFPAMEGNMAAGAKMVLASNPTRLVGTFYDAFNHPKKHAYWHTFKWSGYESPCVTGERDIPGLCTKKWLREKRDEWGADSAEYSVRCLGEFPGQGENTVIGRKRVDEAMARYDRTEAVGKLRIGVDVARFGDDETVIQPVRGLKALPAKVVKGASIVETAGHTLEVIQKYRHTDDTEILVKVDEVGLGAGAVDFLRHMDRAKSLGVRVRGVHVQSKSDRPNEYADLRSQLCFDLRDWLDAGGALYDNGYLKEELLSPEYTFDAAGRRKVSRKDDEKKMIGRSPDRREALELAIYVPKTGSTIGGGYVNI